MKHFSDRRPKGRIRAWSRTVSHDGGLLTYRLWRRDHRNVLHQYHLQYMPIASRKMIAGDLRRAWKILRDRVDAIDLAAMDEAA